MVLLSQLKNPAASNIRFQHLFQVAPLVLFLPNSNAGHRKSVFPWLIKTKRTDLTEIALKLRVHLVLS